MLVGGKNSSRRNLLALLIAAPWIFVAFLRILALDSGWPMVPLVAFTPQTLLTMLLPLIAAILLRARWATIGIVLVMVWLAVIIAPRTFSHDQPTAADKTVRVYSANLKKGGAEGGALLEQVRASRADIIALQEAGDSNLAALRAGGLLETHPHVVKNSSDGTYANFTISRWPLRAFPDEFNMTGRWPGIRVVGTGITFFNFHSLSPTTPGRDAGWSAALNSLPAAAGKNRIIAGDFNATLDHRLFRAVLDRGYVDTGYETGSGLSPTWSIGFLTRLTLDHVLVPTGAAVRSYQLQTLPGSDHRSISTTFELSQ